MVGAGDEMDGNVPVVMELASSSHTKILPDTNQLLPTDSEIVALVPPLSSSPATFIVKVC